MLLPQFQSDSQALTQMQNRWAAEINPFISRLQNRSTILKEVSLVTGANIINHGLDHVLNGWKIVRQRASASIYDTQDSNPSPAISLYLNTSADVVVDIEVF